MRFDLCVLPYFLCPFPGPYRVSVPGRLVPVGSDCAGRRRAVSRGSVYPWSEKRVGVGCRALVRPSGRRHGLESKAMLPSPRPGLPVGGAGRSQKWCLARPSGRRGHPEAGWRPKRALQSERWARVGSGCHSSSPRPFGQRLDRPSGLSFRYLGRPMSCALYVWAEPLLGSQSARDPGFMNPTGAPGLFG